MARLNNLPGLFVLLSTGVDYPQLFDGLKIAIGVIATEDIQVPCERAAATLSSRLVHGRHLLPFALDHVKTQAGVQEALWCGVTANEEGVLLTGLA